MANQTIINGWGFVGLASLAFCVLGLLAGHYVWDIEPTTINNTITETITTPADYLIIDDINYTKEDVKELLDIKADFTDEIREDTVTELAKEAIEADYIEDLDFDEDAFDDSDFKIAWVDFDLDEDEGDYFVHAEFIVMEYNEDKELINQYNCFANLDVKDNNAIKHLQIDFIPLPK